MIRYNPGLLFPTMLWVLAYCLFVTVLLWLIVYLEQPSSAPVVTLPMSKRPLDAPAESPEPKKARLDHDIAASALEAAAALFPDPAVMQQEWEIRARKHDLVREKLWPYVAYKVADRITEASLGTPPRSRVKLNYADCRPDWQALTIDVQRLLPNAVEELLPDSLLLEFLQKTLAVRSPSYKVTYCQRGRPSRGPDEDPEYLEIVWE
jgi:hypothetical protein